MPNDMLRQLVETIARLSARVRHLEAAGITAAIPLHAKTHQDGGADEISVAGLSGKLADAQTPSAHKASHQDGGSDEISLTGLDGSLGWLRLKAASITIDDGAITPTASYILLETEGGAATDDLDTIDVTGTAGTIIVLRTNSSLHDVTVKDGTGNLTLAGDMALSNRLDAIVLMEYGAGGWMELARSDNA